MVARAASWSVWVAVISMASEAYMAGEAPSSLRSPNAA